MTTAEKRKLEKFPSRIDNNEILQLVNNTTSHESNSYMKLLKDITNADDRELSSWLDINEKTFRNYKNTFDFIKLSLLEHTLMLITLFKHGRKIFGTSDQFMKWLKKENFHFNRKAPIDYIGTVSGMRFIDDRLTGIEYGDNA
jgi:uncharacterized protein (DUF2384 family)